MNVDFLLLLFSSMNVELRKVFKKLIFPISIWDTFQPFKRHNSTIQIYLSLFSLEWDRHQKASPSLLCLMNSILMDSFQFTCDPVHTWSGDHGWFWKIFLLPSDFMYTNPQGYINHMLCALSLCMLLLFDKDYIYTISCTYLCRLKVKIYLNYFTI